MEAWVDDSGADKQPSIPLSFQTLPRVFFFLRLSLLSYCRCSSIRPQALISALQPHLLRPISPPRLSLRSTIHTVASPPIEYAAGARWHFVLTHRVTHSPFHPTHAPLISYPFRPSSLIVSEASRCAFALVKRVEERRWHDHRLKHRRCRNVSNKNNRSNTLDS